MQEGWVQRDSPAATTTKRTIASTPRPVLVHGNNLRRGGHGRALAVVEALLPVSSLQRRGAADDHNVKARQRAHLIYVAHNNALNLGHSNLSARAIARTIDLVIGPARAVSESRPCSPRRGERERKDGREWRWRPGRGSGEPAIFGPPKLVFFLFKTPRLSPRWRRQPRGGRTRRGGGGGGGQR